MPIPDYQSIMLPLLKLAGDKKEHSMREAIESVSRTFNLTDTEKKELLRARALYHYLRPFHSFLSFR